MKKTLALLPLASMTGLAFAAPKEKAPQKPNIIFIYADDIGYGDLSCNGAKRISTPNVDKLAAEGIRFTDAHSAAATSTPSRYAMLTGEYAWRKKGTGIADGDAALIIRPDRYTLADMFKQAGYKTGAIGKWHLGLGNESGTQDWNNQLSPGLSDIGFDYSYIMAATGDRVPCVFVKNGLVENLDPNDPIEVSYKKNFPGEPTGKNNPELLKMQPSHGHNQSIVNGISRIGYMKGGKSALWTDENIADQLTGQAISYIERYKDEPFFLYFATQDAHVPRVPHPRFAGKSDMGPRGDVLLQFDWSVGEVMNTLKRLGLDENTIVILSSDNGPVIDDGYQDQAIELLGDHTPWGPYRGAKYSSFEAGTRVPAILRWKGNVKPQVSDALMCQIDWFASFADLLNVNIPQGAAPDSENHLNAWLGKDKKGREWLVEQNAMNNLSLTNGRYKYIEPSDGPAVNKNTKIELGNSRQPQLYDLKKDCGETVNRATDKEKLTKQFHDKLQEIKDNRYLQ
ncbi:MAG: sulfatase family protein [Bacteroidales bacterium]